MAIALHYRNRFFYSFAILALLQGGMIYVFLRSPELVFIEWISSLGLEFLPGLNRQISFSLHIPLPEWFSYSFPNALWAFAYALIITRMWIKSGSWLKYIWFASIPIMVMGFEILQLTGTIRGTFCIEDMAFGMAGLFLGMTLGMTPTKHKNHEKGSN